MPMAFLQKRSTQILAITLTLSLLLVTTMTVLAAIGQAPIKADKGGTIIIDDDTRLIIPAGALEKNTLIRIKMVSNNNKLTFAFTPKGLQFKKPVQLQKSKASMNDAEGFTLYFAPDEDKLDNYSETIHPDIDSKNVKWNLNHFSIYYYRRR